MRVGRAPIDEDAIRLLEQHNPDVQFDWTRILKQPPVTEQSQRPQKPPPQKPRRDERAPREREVESGARTPAPPAIDEPPIDEPSEMDAEIAADAQLTDTHVEALVDPNPAPVAGRVGAEGLARLRARYAEVMARLAEKPLDEPVRDELKARAERLNPDAWVTDDEVRDGLEQYETVFESLRPLLGHPRRRRRRRG